MITNNIKVLNNTDNNYTDYSNTYPFLSVLESLDMKGMKLLQ